MRKRSPKSESMPRNWARQALLKNFDFGQSQRSMVNSQWLGCWRYSRAYVAGRDTGRRVWHVGAHEAHDGDGLSVWGAWWRVMECGVVWSACSWDKNFSRRVGARVRWFLAVLGWLLLGIICSITLCLCFSSWMSKTMRSESCRLVGVTTVTRFWQWLLDEGKGSERTPEMSTGTRKSEEWLWYHVNNIKCEKDWIVYILMCV